MNKEESYQHCIDLLKRCLPLNIFSPATKENWAQYCEFFEYHQPNNNEKMKFVQLHRETFNTVANEILHTNGLNNQITISQMVRCISKNIHLFAYVIIYMSKGSHSVEINEIKKSYLENKKKVFISQEQNLDV